MEEPHSRGTPTMLTASMVVAPHVRVDVHVLGAGSQRVQVIGEVFEWAHVVGAEDRNNLCKACRCAVPFFLGRVVASAVEEHAEATR